MASIRGVLIDLGGVVYQGRMALPGSIGTMEELFEMYTWSQLGIHSKPIGVLDLSGYYFHLFAQLDLMVSEGFLEAATRDLLVRRDTVAGILAELARRSAKPDPG